MPQPKYPVANPYYYSGNPGTQPGNTGPLGSGYLDNTRRTYDFYNYVARLNVQAHPFLSYIQMLRRNPTNDVNFKFLEEREQWQRRDFTVHPDAAKANTAVSSGAFSAAVGLTTKVDKYGRVTDTNQVPIFLLKGQILDLEVEVEGLDAAARYGVTKTKRQGVFLVESFGTHGSDHAMVTVVCKSIDGYEMNVTNFPDSIYKIGIAGNYRGSVIGTAFGEGTGPPDGWTDDLFDRQGWCQIFKTSVPLFSGTVLAMGYRGEVNEWSRTWRRSVMEHKHNINRAFLFGQGTYAETHTQITTPTTRDAVRYTWGIIPFIKRFGITKAFTYASSTYDTFVDFLEEFISPTKGMMDNNVTLHVSRKIATWFNKIGNNSFTHNTVGAMSGGQSTYPMMSVNKGVFGNIITSIWTRWGTIHMMVEEELKGAYEDTAFITTISNLEYRPLAGNGYNRDYIVETNVELPGTDGRKDQIISECGLCVKLPETHAVLTFS